LPFFKISAFWQIAFWQIALWQIAKLLNSQNYFSFQGLPIDCKVGAKNKIKTIVDIFSSFNFQFFFFLKQSSTVCE